MPASASKRATHRARAAEAARRVILLGGVEAANLRAIANEMGATTGLLTRYFPDKRELLRETLSGACDVLGTHLQSAITGQTGMALVRAGMRAALPLDSQRIDAWAIWAGFAGLLAGDAGLGKIHRQFPDALRQVLIRGLREGQREGGLATSLYPAFAADALISQIIGTAMRVVADPGGYSSAKIEAVAAGAFVTLLGA